MLKQITEMLKLQDELEVHICGKNWKKLNYPWPLYINMECMEIIEHVGYKHWKKTSEPNWDVIAMEVVDVWHFILAFMLVKNIEAEQLTDIIMQTEVELAGKPKQGIIETALGLGFGVLSKEVVPFGNFVTLLYHCGMSFKQLHKLYISKWVLNKFRKDHGYQNGEYLKTWAGAEDNEHLMELSKKYDNADELYKALAGRYALAGH